MVVYTIILILLFLVTKKRELELTSMMGAMLLFGYQFTIVEGRIEGPLIVLLAFVFANIARGIDIKSEFKKDKRRVFHALLGRLVLPVSISMVLLNIYKDLDLFEVVRLVGESQVDGEISMLIKLISSYTFYLTYVFLKRKRTAPNAK